jgi:hypothetical protein
MNQKGAGSKWRMLSEKKKSPDNKQSSKDLSHTATTYNSRELLLHKPT